MRATEVYLGIPNLNRSIARAGPDRVARLHVDHRVDAIGMILESMQRLYLMREVGLSPNESQRVSE